jgi:hypothetical protein
LHFQDAVIAKELHDAIKIVHVEGIAQAGQCRSDVHSEKRGLPSAPIATVQVETMMLRP